MYLIIMKLNLSTYSRQWHTSAVTTKHISMHSLTEWVKSIKPRWLYFFQRATGDQKWHLDPWL